MAFTTIQRQYPCLSLAHFTRARGSAEQNRIYCTKEPRLDGPWTTGAPAPDTPGSGHRSDLDAAMLAIRDGMTDFEMHTDFAQILAQYPKVKKVLKFINVTCQFVCRYRALYRESLVRIEPLVPRAGWQSLLGNLLDGPVDPRKINWFWSNGGNIGKSYFANHWKPEESYVVNGGKHCDIYYALSTRMTSIRTVFFDFARMQESMPYVVMECLKNGRFTSTKYESQAVLFNPVHVVVFSNAAPDMNVFSLDRWNIQQLF